MVYTKEDMDTDLSWFSGYNVDEADAKSYIIFLLKEGNNMTLKDIEEL